MLAYLSEHGASPRRAGDAVWFPVPGAVDRGQGRPISYAELIEWLNANLFRGERTLQVVASKEHPARLGIAYTDAGRLQERTNRYWSRRVPAGVLIGRWGFSA